MLNTACESVMKRLFPSSSFESQELIQTSFYNLVKTRKHHTCRFKKRALLFELVMYNSLLQSRLAFPESSY